MCFVSGVCALTGPDPGENRDDGYSNVHEEVDTDKSLVDMATTDELAKKK